eukprot:XP_001689617.1 predicted protein [Chlamydomonas reinhardtii]
MDSTSFIRSLLRACYGETTGPSQGPSEPQDYGDVWSKLGSDLIRSIAKELHPHDVAAKLRPLSRATAEALRDMRTTIQLTYRIHHLKYDWDVIVGCQEAWPGKDFVAHWGRPDPWRALSLARRRRLLCLAASSHHAGSLEAALDHCDVKLEADVFESAAAAGDLEACKRLTAQGCPVSGLGLCAAAFGGNLQVVKFVMQILGDKSEVTGLCYGHPCADAAVYAAAGGHAAVLEWAAARRPSAVLTWRCLGASVMWAAHHGHGELLEQMLLNLVPSGLVKWHTRFSQAWLVARAIGALAADAFRNAIEDTEIEDNSYDIGVAVEEDVEGWGAVAQPQFGKRLARLAGLAAYGVEIREDWRRRLGEVLAKSGNVMALRELLGVWESPIVDSILAHNVVHWAVRHGHVPVLELLRERLGSHAFSSDHAMTALKHRPCRMNGVRYIAALDGDITADPFGYMHTSWDAVFSEAARRGADAEQAAARTSGQVEAAASGIQEALAPA